MARRTPLHIALEKESDIEIIETLLAAGADVNVTNENEETPLHIAVKTGRGIELVGSLLAAGADINATYGEETALFCAVKKNSDLRVIKALLMAGGDVNCRDGNGNTLLHVVCNPGLANELISLGLGINAVNVFEETPLHMAAIRKGRGIALIKTLLDTGADVNAKKKYEETPLYCAVKNNIDLRVIKVLLMAGGDVNCRDDNGNTLLHVVCNAGLASELISLGLGINDVNKFKETPLHIAFIEGKEIELIETLMVAGADVNASNCGQTALHCAVSHNSDLRLIKALIMAGGDVHVRDCSKNSLLHVVCNADLASELISLGLDINAVNDHEETPLHTAARKGRGTALIETLLAAGADVKAVNSCGETALYCAVNNNCDFKVFKALLMAGADLNCGVNGNTLLHIVGNAEVASELISLRLDVNAENLIFNGTPLYFAIMRGRGIQLIESLLAAGADVNATYNDGKNSLYYAIERDCDVKVIRALLKAGGDLNFMVNGNTLLHVVGSADVARELLSQGLNVNATNDYGETPLCCVAKNAPGYYGLFEHELYVCYAFPYILSEDGRVNVCYDCKLKELVRTLILHGAVLRLDVNSPLEMLETGNLPWAEFFMKVDIMKSCFDRHEEAICLSSYRSFLNKLKTRTLQSDSYYSELSQFLHNAIAEIVHMKCDMISDNHSLYNYFFKCQKSEKVFPLFPRSDNTEEEISIKYPIYRELILPKIRASVKRSTLLDKLKGLTIYVKTPESEEISLKYYILYEIVEYLSDDDLENLIKCIIDE